MVLHELKSQATETSKTLTIALLMDALGDANDNAYRAQRAFRSYGPERMDSQYQQGSFTPRQLLAGYEDRLESILAAIEWVKAQPD